MSIVIIGIRAPALLVVALVATLVATSVQAENIDPGNDGSQYAWSENTGWLNAEPANCADCGVEVTASELSGWMWGENIGWINMNCSNNATCGTVNYGVTNDGAGNLAGYAWAENGGWISFSCSNTSYCGTVNYGVTIDTGTGEFDGYAWSENLGWISFSCANTSSCGTVDYGVETAWTAGIPGDTDLDGCTDVQENGLNANAGGLRDPNNFWDFFDTWTPDIQNPGQYLMDRAITADDITEVAKRFLKSGTETTVADALTPPTSPTDYHASYDVGALLGPNPWNVGPANGSITADDITAVALQFLHSC